MQFNEDSRKGAEERRKVGRGDAETPRPASHWHTRSISGVFICVICENHGSHGCAQRLAMAFQERKRLFVKLVNLLVKRRMRTVFKHQQL